MLRIEIRDVWEPYDFIEVLQAVESMYYKLSSNRFRDYPMPLRYFDERYYWNRTQMPGLPFENNLDFINSELLSQLRYDARQKVRLKVRRISYASPGSIDLLGLGKVVEVIADSIGRMTSHFEDSHLRRERDEQASLESERKRIEIEQERESLRSLKIANARAALDLMRDYPDQREALVPLLVRDQDHLSDKIAEQKLVGAKVVKNEEIMDE